MAVKWSYQAEMINACNCDWGCPCNFNAKPTNGFCEGVYAAHITTGFHGETTLDGLKFAWGAKWPRAIHEGGGTAKIWIDDAASESQQSALEDILTGKPGGLPWMILTSTIDHWLETAYVRFEWNYDGIRSSYKAGTEVQAALEAMRNPVSGQESSAKIVLPEGIVTKELEASATRTFSVFTKGLKIAAPGKYGFCCTVEHSN